jgi:3-oxoacyl-[acyl-carrier protein] reductase
VDDLKGRVVIITGAGQGIGRCYAHRFAAVGAIPILAEINEGNSQRVVEEIKAAGPGMAVPIATDVSSPKSVRQMTETVLDRFGRIDVLINNAALYSRLTRGTFDQLPLEEWDDVLRVNVTGAFLCCREVLPTMREAKWGRIINISSGTVTLGRPNFMHYVTSKAALIGMTRAMARELGPSGITVNAVLPGLTKTEIEAAGATQAVWDIILQQQCIPRAGTPEDVAELVMFLASSASGFITGQCLAVDGGATHR